MEGTLKQRLVEAELTPEDIVRQVREAMDGPKQLSCRAAILQVAPGFALQTVRGWMQTSEQVKPAGRRCTLTPAVDARLVAAIKEHADRGVAVSESTVRAWV
jgi:hypothetical protein